MNTPYRLCYISRNYRGTGSAGNKAKTDNEDTLMAAGAVNLGVHRTFHRSKVVTFFLDLAGIMKYVFSVRRDDVLLLQYPVKKYFSFICTVARLRGAKTIALIHDLGSFRRKKLTVNKEMTRLMHADYVIASNSVMRQWLSFLGHDTPVFTGGERIMQKMDDAVFYVEMERPSRGKYICTFNLLSAHAAEEAENDITRRFFLMLENTIRNNPSYYLWTHNRWKRTHQRYDEIMKKEKDHIQ